MIRIDAHHKIKSAVNEGKPFVFVSSLVLELVQDRIALNKLNDLDESYLPLYIDELFWEDDGSAPLDTVDRLLDILDKSSIVIVLLAKADLGKREFRGRGITNADTGSLITLKNLAEVEMVTSVSFWEIELFKVALSKKPLYFIATPDFQPGPHLLQFFEMVPWLTPRILKMNSRSELINTIKKIINPALNTKDTKSYVFPLKKYQASLELWKSDSAYNDVFVKHINWGIINKQWFTSPPNFDLITREMEVFGAERNVRDRLSRLWLIYRELFRVPYTNPKYHEFLPIWNDFFYYWMKGAKWYDLHGSIDLGVIPVLNKLAEVRSLIASNPLLKSKLPPVMTEYPAADLASGYYSRATMFNRRDFFEAALSEIEKGLNIEPSNKAQLISTRAAINLRFFRPDKAINDYEKALKIHESEGASQHTIGAALSDLGFAWALTVVGFYKGRKMMIEGINMMQEDGLKVRAYRKLAKLHPIGSDRKWFLSEARRIATLYNYTGQMRQLDQF